MIKWNLDFNYEVGKNSGGFKPSKYNRVSEAQKIQSANTVSSAHNKYRWVQNLYDNSKYNVMK